MEREQVQARLSATAFAFGGYGLTNLGRSDELLAHPVYGRIVRDELQKASAALLRSLYVQHVILEDWLLEQEVR